MKYIISFNESVSSYNYKFDENNMSYEFSDGNNEFKVDFTYITEDDIYELKWYLKKDGFYTYDIVNSNIFKIMETVLGKILNDFIKRFDDCNSILICGLSKNHEKNEITQRTNVYFRYLKSHPIDGWIVDRYQNEIYLDKKDK